MYCSSVCGRRDDSQDTDKNSSGWSQTTVCLLQGSMAWVKHPVSCTIRVSRHLNLVYCFYQKLLLIMWLNISFLSFLLQIFTIAVWYDFWRGFYQILKKIKIKKNCLLLERRYLNLSFPLISSEILLFKFLMFAPFSHPFWGSFISVLKYLDIQCNSASSSNWYQVLHSSSVWDDNHLQQKILGEVPLKQWGCYGSLLWGSSSSLGLLHCSCQRLYATSHPIFLKSKKKKNPHTIMYTRII